MELLEREPDLLKRFAAGDPDAFEALFREFQGRVYGWIVRLVRDVGVAEDLTVETFWRIHRARARFDVTRSFAAWARRIGTNVALDHLKKARREIPLPDNLPVTPPDPAVRQQLRERTEAALRQLPPKYQAVVVLALVEECPHGEIAEALGLPSGTVKTRVFRGLRLLRKALQKAGIEP